MKHNNQLEKNSKIANDCHGLYAVLSVMDYTQLTTKFRKKKDDNLTLPWTVHGMSDHGLYTPSLAMDRMWRHRQRIL